MLFRSGTFTAHAAPVCGGGNSDLPIPLPVSGSKARYSSMSEEEALLRRCETYVSDLRAIANRAGYIARTGQLSKAADTLFQGLQAKAASVVGLNREPEAPHTVMAIKAGYEIASATMTSTGKQSGRLGQMLTGQVRYQTLSEIYNLIINAYEDLDAAYFYQTYNVCNRGCYGDGYFGLPFEYYNGVAELAHKFLSLQSRDSQMQASDNVELKISRAVAKGAKNILMNSVFRRSYACTISSLHGLENDITEHLNGCGYMSTVQFVDYVRDRIEQASYNTYTCR